MRCSLESKECVGEIHEYEYGAVSPENETTPIEACTIYERKIVFYACYCDFHKRGELVKESSTKVRPSLPYMGIARRKAILEKK